VAREELNAIAASLKLDEKSRQPEWKILRHVSLISLAANRREIYFTP
jgi:hypothetical protein